MNEQSRITALQNLLERNPNDTRALFGLANEYEKQQQWSDVVAHLSRYLSLADDEGNAWGRLAHALRVSGRSDEAREAYKRGIKEAEGHGHPSMAAEFAEILDEL
jgi:Flp pilus assembly protein TadD